MNLTWLFIAFLAAWAIIGFYVFTIAARQRRLEQRLDEVDRSPR